MVINGKRLKMSLFLTNYMYLFFYNLIGDNMKVKLFDEESELDLQDDINKFIADVDVIDIKYQVSLSVFSEEQIYSFSAMIIYKDE